jgi:outer membrane protein OmpA-like peptidoglycan-associated protein
VSWYRDLTGTSKDDGADAGGRNEQNLEAGSKAPFPNLATVPSPPETATSSVDRDKLQKGLAADRAHAKYSDEELRQGRSVPTLPGEPPAAPPAQAAALPATAPAAASPAGEQPNPSAAKGRVPPPQESPLTTPSVHMLPHGESSRTAPPAPTRAPPQQQAAVLPPPRPASPNRTPVVPTAQPSIMRLPGKAATVSVEAAEIGFAQDGRSLTAADGQRLADAAKLYKQAGGRLRVIAYGRRGYGADAAEQELASFGEALDRANAVAQALAKLGVSPARITVQAAPEFVAGGLAAGRAEVLLEY